MYISWVENVISVQSITYASRREIWNTWNNSSVLLSIDIIICAPIQTTISQYRAPRETQTVARDAFPYVYVCLGSVRYPSSHSDVAWVTKATLRFSDCVVRQLTDGMARHMPDACDRSRRYYDIHIYRLLHRQIYIDEKNIHSLFVRG